MERSSAYANFQVDRKEEFLRAIAWELTLRYQRWSFDHFQLEKAYRSVCESFALPKEDCRRVVREIESHTGLFLEISYETFGFAHRSTQEYLAAEYILRLPDFPAESVLSLPQEMALVVAMSSDPAQHFRKITESALQARERDVNGFSLPFVRRLFLEKVDFRSNADFGRSIAELFATTFYPSVGPIQQLGLPFGVSSKIFREFLSLEGVHSSLRAALLMATREPNGGGTWRLKWNSQKSQNNILEEGIVVDSGFFQLAGLAPDNGSPTS